MNWPSDAPASGREDGLTDDQKRTGRVNRRARGITFRIGILLLCAAPLGLVSSAETFAAEKVGKRRTILQLLFGKRQKPEPPPAEVPQPRRKSTRRSVVKIETKAPVSADAKKASDALAAENTGPVIKVLVAGDFMASGLARGLEDAFADVPNVDIESRTSAASGLVRNDYYDWQAKLPSFVEQLQPSIVVIMVGSNDRQALRGVAGNPEPLSEDWQKEYVQRVQALVRTATSKSIPVMWMGLPSFPSASMSADMIKLNELYRREVGKMGGEFVDIWDGYVDDAGKFVMSGPDVNGQQVRLRGPKGINMTDAGFRKLAFYAEKPIRRLLGGTSIGNSVLLNGSNLPDLMSLPPSQLAAVTRVPPIGLFDPELDGGKTLLGATPYPGASGLTARDLLLESTDTTTAPPGRVDYYALPRQQ
jgi:uncharacterized protein